MSNFFLTNPIKLSLGNNVADVKSRLAHLLNLRENQILSFTLHKQSIDARDKSDVHFVCSYVVETETAQVKNARPYVLPQDLLGDASVFCDVRGHCIVVGGGPAGLFLARYLTENGVKVTVIERGADVEKRNKAVQTFFRGGEFDPHTNVQFGLGGAGTFSDGKLTTGISSPLMNTVFQEFVRRGAPSDILTNAMPHIGTDNLVTVVANLHDEIIKFGGEFLFDTCVNDLIIKNDKIIGVETVDSEGNTKSVFADCVALCCGHSSRELFETLAKRGIAMQFKPFAVGLRVEHTRKFIDTVQYGEIFATHRDLGAATYKLVHNTATHSCYSFCMCPGGVVVPANSQPNTVVVNGMSNSARSGAGSNSALVVTVSAADVAEYGFERNVLCGMDFQQALENAAYVAGGGNYRAPYQNVTDFLSGKISTAPDVEPSYPRGVAAVDFRNLLPSKICNILSESLVAFDKKMKNFAKCGTLIGVETRTSSPVKILRNSETLQSLGTRALFPCGEGAGYSGGIVSSAVDGLKVARKIVEFLHGI